MGPCYAGRANAKSGASTISETVMSEAHFYPIGVPGQKWGESELARWRSRQVRHRQYALDVVPRIEALAESYDKIAYGTLDYAGERYELLALKSRNFDSKLPLALI